MEDSTMRVPLLGRGGSVRGYALVDAKDYDAVARRRWFLTGGYAYRHEARNGKQVSVYMHRELMGLAQGDARQVDHINRNGLDNRRSNIRLVTAAENRQNQGHQRGSATGVRGVYWRPDIRKYVALVQVRYQRHYLGLFETLGEADAAACGGRARLMAHSPEAGEV